MPPYGRQKTEAGLCTDVCVRFGFNVTCRENTIRILTPMNKVSVFLSFLGLHGAILLRASRLRVHTGVCFSPRCLTSFSCFLCFVCFFFFPGCTL